MTRAGVLAALDARARSLAAQPDRVHHCDALTLLRALPDASVDAVITDPPYFKVKPDWWDHQWDDANSFIEWIGQLCQEWRRVLKPNGSLYVFASPQMAARVEVEIARWFNVLNSLVWYKTTGNRNWSADKEQVRGFLPNTERIIFAEQKASDYEYAQQDWLLHSRVFKPMKDWFRERSKKFGLTLNDLNSALGTATGGGGMASHYFGNGKNFELPTQVMYMKMQAIHPRCFNRDYSDLRREYEDLRREYEDLRREYEDLRRPFNITAHDQFTDVWRFKTVPAYIGKHPAEKPLALLKHIIKTSTKRGAVILDPFAGSGATCDAARQLGRHYIACDLDAHWAAYARRRLSHAYTPDMFAALDRGA